MSSAAPVEETLPFDAVGGREGVQAIVERFYDLMDSVPAYAELRSLHASDLGPMRKSLAGFLTGWLGGPADWFAANPGKCMMTLHNRFSISAAIADQWVKAMDQAMRDCAVEGDVAKRIGAAFASMASAMVRA
ncbi:hypothetical protein L288_07245 [Sphingobium quisquiliarum P25]|uniref:Globin n=1 Tax=Sphingobium quisquiliarum P25 TaxID=1329909 RepID=T0IAY3_9SPHN|nr:group II truncated hemoglobin [Sphingobium quisquiliarum]EQB08815.1 hypothetical protein L288_07245 [Sphingobium quisquiliarum P25]